MDSFAIDYLSPDKAKHRNRAWMHLVYSDPKKVSQGLLQFQNRRTLAEGNQNIFHKYSPDNVSTALKNISTPKIQITEKDQYTNYLYTGMGAIVGGFKGAKDEGLLSYDPEQLVQEINEDPIIASMSEQDKSKFSNQYVQQRRLELRKTIKSARKIDRIIEDELMQLYNDYEEKYENNTK